MSRIKPQHIDFAAGSLPDEDIYIKGKSIASAAKTLCVEKHHDGSYNLADVLDALADVAALSINLCTEKIHESKAS